MAKSRKQSNRSKPGKNKGKGKRGGGNTVMGAVGGALKTALKAGIPLAMKAMMPFPTSGSYAMASPGMGVDTALSAPVANGAIVRTSKANIRNDSGGITVRHREFLTDVSPVDSAGNSPFQILVSEQINPSNSTLFPWLSAMTSRYESFQFQALRFIYEPQCSTTTNGTIMMAVNYDVDDPEPSSKVELMSFKGAVRSPPWFAGVNCSALSDMSKQKSYFISEPAVSGAPSRLSNVGQFYLAYEGADFGTFGELYVEYDVRFSTPTLEDNAAKSTTFSSFNPDLELSNQKLPSAGSVTFATLGSQASYVRQGNLKVSLLDLGRASSTGTAYKQYTSTVGIVFPQAGVYQIVGSFNWDQNAGQYTDYVWGIAASSGSDGVTLSDALTTGNYSELPGSVPTFSGAGYFIVARTTSVDGMVILTFQSVVSLGDDVGEPDDASGFFLLNFTEVPLAAFSPYYFSSTANSDTTLTLKQQRLLTKWQTSSYKLPKFIEPSYAPHTRAANIGVPRVSSSSLTPLLSKSQKGVK